MLCFACCWFVCQQDSFRQILMKFLEAMECVIRNELLDFDGDPDYGAYPGIFKWFYRCGRGTDVRIFADKSINCGRILVKISWGVGPVTSWSPKSKSLLLVIGPIPQEILTRIYLTISGALSECSGCHRALSLVENWQIMGLSGRLLKRRATAWKRTPNMSPPSVPDHSPCDQAWWRRGVNLISSLSLNHWRWLLLLLLATND